MAERYTLTVNLRDWLGLHADDTEVVLNLVRDDELAASDSDPGGQVVALEDRKMPVNGVAAFDLYSTLDLVGHAAYEIRFSESLIRFNMPRRNDTLKGVLANQPVVPTIPDTTGLSDGAIAIIRSEEWVVGRVCYIANTAPTGDLAPGELWANPSASWGLSVYDGSAWQQAFVHPSLEVHTDATIAGSNTAVDPLRVAFPFTQAEKAKLDRIAAEDDLPLGMATRTGSDPNNVSPGNLYFANLNSNNRFLVWNPEAAYRDTAVARWHAGTTFKFGDYEITLTSNPTAPHVQTDGGELQAHFSVVSGAPPAQSARVAVVIPGVLVHTGDLATVARTGSYGDLVNRPSIPSIGANPEGASTGTLSKLLVNGVVYALAASGGGNPRTAGAGLTLTGNELSVTNPFTDADESKLDGIEAGAEVNPTVSTRFAVQPGDTQDGISNGVIGVYNGSTEVQSASINTATALYIPDAAAAPGTDPTAPGTNLAAVTDQGSMLENARLHNGHVAVIITQSGSTATAHCHVVSSFSGGWQCTVDEWVGNFTLTTGIAAMVGITATAAAFLSHDAIGVLPIDHGGTGASDAAGARTALGITQATPRTAGTGLTLTGNELSVTNPFTEGDEAKLGSIPIGGRSARSLHLVRTLVDSSSSAVGEVLQSTNNTAQYGVQDFLGADYDPSSGASQRTAMETFIAGDTFLLTGPNNTWLLGEIKGAEDNSDNARRDYWYSVEHSFGLDSFRQLPTGAANLYLMSDVVDVIHGGTGAMTAATARINLGLANTANRPFASLLSTDEVLIERGVAAPVHATLEDLHDYIQGDDEDIDTDNVFYVNDTTETYYVQVTVSQKLMRVRTTIGDPDDMAALDRLRLPNAWLRFGNDAVVRVVSNYNKATIGIGVTYSFIYEVLEGTVPSTGSYILTVVGRDVHRGELNKQIFKDSVTNVYGKGGVAGYVWSYIGGNTDAGWLPKAPDLVATVSNVTTSFATISGLTGITPGRVLLFTGRNNSSTDRKAGSLIMEYGDIAPANSSHGTWIGIDTGSGGRYEVRQVSGGGLQVRRQGAVISNNVFKVYRY